MTVREIVQDPEALTLTAVSTFTAPVERVWQVWADPRLLEKWWGPPGWPATFVKHDLRVGGTALYFMQGPDGTQHHGGWMFTAVQAPTGLSLDDYFCDEHGTPNLDLPGCSMIATLAEAGGVTTMTLLSTFGSLEQLEQSVAMGMLEGLRAAMGQIDALL